MVDSVCEIGRLECKVNMMCLLGVGVGVWGVGGGVVVGGGGVFFFQAEDGIRDLVRSRGLGDVYKRQGQRRAPTSTSSPGRAGGPCGRCCRGRGEGTA